MPRFQFHLGSMVWLVLLAGLGLAAGIRLSRWSPNDLAEQGMILLPILVPVGLKFSLILAARLKRGAPEDRA